MYALDRSAFAGLSNRKPQQPLRRRPTCAAPAPAATAAAAGPTPSPAELEAQEEFRLRTSPIESIYGIPRADWLQLETPARYLGNEFGAVHKPWASADIRFSLTYPEIYEVGASNLGHIILYGLLNQQEGLLCDRAYYPGDDLKALLVRYGKQLFGVESRRPLSQFDVLGFSL